MIDILCDPIFIYQKTNSKNKELDKKLFLLDYIHNEVNKKE